MKTFAITFTSDSESGIYSANLCKAETAEQAKAYFESLGKYEVIGVAETLSEPKPGQPIHIVPDGWKPEGGDDKKERGALSVSISRNEEKNGIEIRFSGIPAAEVRDELKAHGFRWSRFGGCWYHHFTEEAKAFAESLQDEKSGESAEAPKLTERSGPAVPLPSLWERCKIDALPLYGTENELKKEATANAAKNGTGYDREAAKIIRAHLKKRFPECKFSVTSGGAGYLDNCDIYLCAAPYDMSSDIISSIRKYCDALHDAFDADDGDFYADYGAHHDLYGGVSIKYNFERLPDTPESKIEAERFAEEKANFEKEEQARKIAEMEELQKRREEEEKGRAEREKKEAEDVAEIEQAAEIEEYSNEDSYFCRGYEFRKLGTMAALEEYKREYGAPLVMCKIIRCVTLPAAQLLKFREMLFSDFSFFAGQGGSGTNDPRINSADDWNKMSYEEQKTVEWFCLCTAIKCKESGDIAFLVNPEGFNYARYIYIIDGGRLPVPPSHDGDKISEIVDMIEDASTNAIDSLHMAGSGDWMKSHDYYKIMSPILDVITPEIIQHITIEPLKNWLYDAVKKKKFNDKLLPVLEIGRDITIVKDNLKIACGKIFSISFDDDENVKLSLVKSSKYLFNVIISYKDELSIYDGEISFDLSMIHNISDARNFAKITGHDAIF